MNQSKEQARTFEQELRWTIWGLLNDCCGPSQNAKSSLDREKFIDVAIKKIVESRPIKEADVDAIGQELIKAGVALPAKPGVSVEEIQKIIKESRINEANWTQMNAASYALAQAIHAKLSAGRGTGTEGMS